MRDYRGILLPCESSGRTLPYCGTARGAPSSDFRIQQQLFEAGVNVPRPLRTSAVAVAPENFSRVDPRPLSLEFLLEKGLVMERISGISGSRWETLHLGSYAMYKINTLKGIATSAEFPRITEYLKAVCAGLIPRDIHRGNVIFSEKYKSTFLIDFSRWSWWRKPGAPGGRNDEYPASREEEDAGRPSGSFGEIQPAAKQ